MKRPERAAWREPCERCERPPGRLGSGTDCLCGGRKRGFTRFTTFTTSIGPAVTQGERRWELLSGDRLDAVSLKHRCVWSCAERQRDGWRRCGPRRSLTGSSASG